ncbi:MAG TPA: alpha/beta hydrolase [Spirochaetota bacterium]|nr:MAG: putative esterase [Spirochaetes bacterium ADurb.Bin133]HNZ27930.1 alpha/beta hydrolase [Spirochaetota bacterium]HPY87355.1 alpha/beta hydrolase [Spirochaetota bacterium]HQB60734.1 alpha/beta hydrolase [Spirochaetota bacterium]
MKGCRLNYILRDAAFCFIILICFTACQKIFLEGLRPGKIDKSINYDRGTLQFDEEKIKLRYIIAKNVIKNDNPCDFIIYLHGIGRTELDWVDEKSFGKRYYLLLKQNPQLKELPVVSISFGFVYVIYNEAPEPFKADLEHLFINEIVPYFRKELKCNGKIHLIGHSLGGFNALTLSLKYPDVFSNVLAISPFIMPFSPFNEEEYRNSLRGLGLRDPSMYAYQYWIKEAYKDEKNWNNYNPYCIIDNKVKKPLIFLSSAANDYPGFSEFISCFVDKLEKNNVAFFYDRSEGPHKSVSDSLYLSFLRSIQ